MQLHFYKDINSTQDVLEQIALKTNGGACEYYNYCKHCKEPKCFVRQSDTPCADAFLKSGTIYVHCIKYDAAERKESYRKFVLYGQDLVNVQFRDRESGEFKGRIFSYIADIPLKEGDVVKAPTKYGTREARVCRIGVPIDGIQCSVSDLRHIKEAATPRGDIFKGFFD
jgi:hypothetical protein